MSQESVAAVAFASVVGLCLLGVVCSGLRMYGRDAFRQRAFALRDELFLYAADGHIPFNHPAYWRLRLMMNATIRFTHRLTFGEFLLPFFVLVTFRTDADPSPYQLWLKAVSQCDPEVQTSLKKFNDRFMYLITEHTLKYSPFAWPVILVMGAIVGMRQALENMQRDASRVEDCAVVTADEEWLEQQGIVIA
jgi:hypothetical protein